MAACFATGRIAWEQMVYLRTVRPVRKRPAAPGLETGDGRLDAVGAPTVFSAADSSEIALRKEEAPMSCLRLIGLAVAAGILVNCGGPQTIWVHPTKPKEMYVTDRDRCEQAVMQDPKQQNSAQYGSKFGVEDYVEHCLKRDGWLQVEKP